MSWEKTGTSKVVCPCGCGKIYQTHYENDWLSHESGPVIIDCEVCSKKYKIESKYFCPKPYHDYTIYYLTPIDYPDYVKTTGADIVYGERKNLEDIDFYIYLIEHYTLKSLAEAYQEYSEKGYSASVSKEAKGIRGLYREKYGKVKIKLVLEEILKAMVNYNNHIGNYINRTAEDDKEKEEYNTYLKTKREHQIKLDI